METTPDLVERNAGASDQLWVANITCVPTGGGFLYLAVVTDAFSRRIVGWSMAGHLRTGLVQREAAGVIHHSDRITGRLLRQRDARELRRHT